MPRTHVAPELPIAALVPPLRECLAHHRFVVLEAPPGAGKTTGIPPAIMDEPWLRGQRLVMLEPRRLAAIQAAGRIARTLGEEVGQRAGYRIRFDTRISTATRIEIVTEGVLTRRLLGDAELKGVGLLIFDEFHERSLQADLGLALALECAQLRDDLRILVMSATLDGERIAALLQGALPPGAPPVPILRSDGRQFPVHVQHADEARLFALSGVSSSAGYLHPSDRGSPRLSEAFYRSLHSGIRLACKETTGDVLVFLPGSGEIRRAMHHLESQGEAALLIPLYGDLSRREQDMALRPGADGRRRIILSTNIAQTSLTIEGIGAVVDSGFARTSRYDPATGMNGLELVRIARDAAEQRTGRAGRLGPGLCIRLWSRAEHAMLPERTPAEIVEADLAPFLLDVLMWGARPEQLRILDGPPEAALKRASTLLVDLGAAVPAPQSTPQPIASAAGRPLRLTEAGRLMAGLPLHPRLARIMLEGVERGQPQGAARLAALLSERDVIRSGRSQSADVELRLNALDYGDAEADPEACRRVLRVAESLVRETQGMPFSKSREESPHRPASTGALMAAGFPDRLAQRRGKDTHRYRLSSGRGAFLDSDDSLLDSHSGPPFLVAAVIDSSGADARIRMAAVIAEEDLRHIAGGQISKERNVRFDAGGLSVVEEERFHSLVLSQRPLPLSEIDDAAVSHALFTHFLESRDQGGELRLPEQVSAFANRVEFSRRSGEDLPDCSSSHLFETAEEWLLPFFAGLKRPGEIADAIVLEALRQRLSREQLSRLDTLAPERLRVPSGSEIAVDYSAPEPVLAVKLQELFGLAETPCIAGQPLTLHLLSPAGRPVQITRDLRNFWNTTYIDVRKELRGRYPRHPWPEDPWTAPPTRKAKPRGT